MGGQGSANPMQNTSDGGGFQRGGGTLPWTARSAFRPSGPMCQHSNYHPRRISIDATEAERGVIERRGRAGRASRRRGEEPGFQKPGTSPRGKLLGARLGEHVAGLSNLRLTHPRRRFQAGEARALHKAEGFFAGRFPFSSSMPAVRHRWQPPVFTSSFAKGNSLLPAPPCSCHG